MNIVGVVTGVLIVALVLINCWFLTDLIVPQSEIDKIDVIGQWAKDELERRETEGSEVTE